MLSFNELFVLCEIFNLFDPQFTTKRLKQIYEEVSEQEGLAAQVHKNNEDNVIVLEEFMQVRARPPARTAASAAYGEPVQTCLPRQVIMRVALAKAREIPELKALSTPADKVAGWVQTVLFPACTLVMPVNKTALSRAMEDPTGMEEEVLMLERQRLAPLKGGDGASRPATEQACKARAFG
jgi:hypothetical protein